MLAGRKNGGIVIQQIKILIYTLRRSSGRSRHIAATLSICEINLTTQSLYSYYTLTIVNTCSRTCLCVK